MKEKELNEESERKRVKGVVTRFSSKFLDRVITKVWIEYNGIKYEANALWDTGSNLCALTPRMAEFLNFKPYESVTDQNIIYTASGTLSFAKYAPLDYYINGKKLKKMKTYVIESSDPTYDVVIGMPIIGRGKFKLENIMGYQIFKFSI